MLVVGITAAAVGAAGFAVLIALTLAGTAAVIDARCRLLPDHLVVASALPVLVLLIREAAHGHLAPSSIAVGLGIGASAGPLFVAHVISPVAIGFGDVKLAGSLGALVGLFDPAFAMVASCLACAVTAAFGLSTRRSSVAFGPGLVIGAIVALEAARRWSGPVLPWH